MNDTNLSMNGLLVKDWVKEKGMRPEELAARLGVSLGTLNRIFAGRTPSRPTVIALAHVMGIEEADLLRLPSAKKARAAAI